MTSFDLPDAEKAKIVAVLAGGDTEVVWRPDGGGDLRTWAEVMDVVGVSPGRLKILLPQHDGCYVVTRGEWDMKEASLVATAGVIKIETAPDATLANLAELNSIHLDGYSQARLERLADEYDLQDRQPKSTLNRHQRRAHQARERRAAHR